MSFEDFLFLALAAILFNGAEPLRHPGFPINTMLAHFDLEIILLLQSKSRLKVTKALGRDVKILFSRWRLWWSS